MISPDILSGEIKSRKLSGEWITSEKFDIRQTFYSQLSVENSNCPAKDWKFAGQMSGEAKMNFAYSAYQSALIVTLFRLVMISLN